MPRYRSDVHVDQALTNISAAYFQRSSFVGKVLFPTVAVEKDSFKYFTYGRQVFGDGNTSLEWADGSDPPEISNERSTESGLCKQYGGADFVTDSELRNQDAPLNAFADVTEELTERMALEHEKQSATKATTSGNYPAGSVASLGASAKWDVVATSDPIGDIQTGIDVIRRGIGGDGARDIVLVAGPAAHKNLMNHPDIIDFMKRTAGVLPSNADMAGLFASIGVTRYAVGGGIKNTAHEGATESISDIWGDNVILAHVPSGPSIRRAAFGYTFQSVQARVEREPRRNHAVKLIASATWDIEFVSRDASGDSLAGYLIPTTST